VDHYFKKWVIVGRPVFAAGLYFLKKWSIGGVG
jgi:hypothetical protein